MPLTNLTFNQKRFCVGIALGVTAMFLANLEFGWSLFGGLNPKKKFVGSVVVLALVQHFVGPTLREIREYRDAKRGA